ncbi:MAG TPA: hypothetical protein VFS30_16735 [Dehalococcoidia bacterium]|nr:hypothetical protein [Dehalococcoidia bacterium]
MRLLLPVRMSAVCIVSEALATTATGRRRRFRATAYVDLDAADDDLPVEAAGLRIERVMQEGDWRTFVCQK